jgi:hypothetical protein
MADDKKQPEEPRIEQPPEAQPFVVENKMPDKPIISPDGHVVLSKEDIKNRA